MEGLAVEIGDLRTKILEQQRSYLFTTVGAMTALTAIFSEMGIGV